jgi:DNA-binding NarL/FixJ family response regulator
VSPSDFHRRYGSPHLYTTCRTHYGAVLFATGRWQQAEEELVLALRIGKSAEPALHAEALAALAELRLAQGRTEEAAHLIAGYERHPVAAYAAGVIELASGQAAVASSIVRRRLRGLDERALESAGLMELLTEAELAQGRGRQAARWAARLAELGSISGSELIVARGERALGRVLLDSGDHATAAAHLEQALVAFGSLGRPLDVSRTRMLLARAMVPEEQPAAVAEARAALTSFEELGAARDADAAAAFLRSLGAKAARAGRRGLGVLTTRELEVLALLGQGLSNPAIAERLFISRKTVEHHVASILAKLRLSGRGEAAAYALRNLETRAAE